MAYHLRSRKRKQAITVFPSYVKWFPALYFCLKVDLVRTQATVRVLKRHPRLLIIPLVIAVMFMMVGGGWIWSFARSIAQKTYAEEKAAHDQFVLNQEERVRYSRLWQEELVHDIREVARDRFRVTLEEVRARYS